MGVGGIDNYDTAWALLIKEALGLIYRDLDSLISILIDPRLPWAGLLDSTKGPITFGYKTAMWARESYHCRCLMTEGEGHYLVGKASGTIGNLSINPSRMWENLSLLKGLNFSEFVATALSTRGLGRYAAYELMREIVESLYREGIEFRVLLKRHEKVREYLSDEEIDDLLNPESNLGIVGPQIDATLSEIEGGKNPEGQ